MSGSSFLHNNFFPLLCNKILNFEFLDELHILNNFLRNSRFRDSYREDLYTWSPFLEILIEGIHELLIKSIEEVDVYLLKSVLAAELIDFMMDFISYPYFFIVLGIV